MAWTDTDRAMVRRFLAEQRLIHGPCGQPLDVATDPRNESAWLAEEVICYACAAKSAYERGAAQNAHEQNGTTDGVFFVPVFHPERVAGGR